MLYQKKATMRFLIVLLFIMMHVAGSAQVPKTGALSGYIAKLEKEIADAKMYQAELCDWAIRTTPDSMFFYQVPLIPLGTKLCNKKKRNGPK